MNKQRVAAVLCASMVLTASPVNGLALTVEASENEAENNTESSGETKENETEEPEVTENPVSPEENQKEVSSSDKEGEKTDSGEKEENSPKQEKTLILVGMLQKKQTLQNQPGMLQKISSL